MIEDFPRLEIWCGPRKVADLARKDLVWRAPPRLTWTSVLITRNKRTASQSVYMLQVNT